MKIFQLHLAAGACLSDVDSLAVENIHICPRHSLIFFICTAVLDLSGIAGSSDAMLNQKAPSNEVKPLPAVFERRYLSELLPSFVLSVT